MFKWIDSLIERLVNWRPLDEEAAHIIREFQLDEHHSEITNPMEDGSVDCHLDKT